MSLKAFILYYGYMSVKSGAFAFTIELIQGFQVVREQDQSLHLPDEE